MSEPKLEVVNVTRLFEDEAVVAVDGVSFSLAGGETLALLGPSGCGKSTTLNMIVGLDAPTSGDIRIDGRSVLGLSPAKRDVGLVFQDYAVFTHMTVFQNLAFGLSIRRMPKPQIARAVAEIAELLGMTDKLKTRASELGGSELQRVAIGRSLITKPSILLLDEPLSNLEAAARQTMRRELRRLQNEIGLTIVYVTHDQIEALSLADRVAVMRAGKIEQIERSTLICEQPLNTFVAGFLGSPPMNLVRGTLERDGAHTVFRRDGFALALGEAAGSLDGIATIGIRPETIKLVPNSDARMNGTVALVEPRGAEAVVTLESGPVRLKAVTLVRDRPQEGVEVGIEIDPAALAFFSGETGRMLVPGGRA